MASSLDCKPSGSIGEGTVPIFCGAAGVAKNGTVPLADTLCRGGQSHFRYAKIGTVPDEDGTVPGSVDRRVPRAAAVALNHVFGMAGDDAAELRWADHLGLVAVAENPP